MTSDLINDIFTFNEVVIKTPEVVPLNALTEKQHNWTQTFVDEEQTELREAFEAQDIVKMVDAVGDLIYGSMGTLKKMGLTRQQTTAIFVAIHRANMTKQRGDKGRGSDEDATKPDNFVPPEETIGKILFVWSWVEINAYIVEAT